MIKAIGTVNNRKTLLLGLSRRNVELLTEGRPIKVLGPDVGLPHDVFIFFGENEELMIAGLLATGVKLPTPQAHYDDERQESTEQ